MAHHFARFPGFGSLRGSSGGGSTNRPTGPPVIPPPIPYDDSIDDSSDGRGNSSSSSRPIGSIFKSSNRKQASTTTTTSSLSSGSVFGSIGYGTKRNTHPNIRAIAEDGQGENRDPPPPEMGSSSPARDRQKDFKPFIPEPDPISTLHSSRCYRYVPHKGAWKHLPASGVAFDTPEDEEMMRKKPPCSQVTVISWNVDFVSERAEERFKAVLDHIAEDVLQCRRPGGRPVQRRRGSEGSEGDGSGSGSGSGSGEGEGEDEDGADSDALEEPEPTIIMLQEVKASLFPILTSHPWVRKWFLVTPISAEKWPKGATYGNITLVSRSLHLADSHILHFGSTRMQRTGVCVKVKLNYPAPSRERAVLSFVNTHLESLPSGMADRPRQLELASRFLKLEGVLGGVVAGDMNCICEDDAELPKQNGLRDACRPGKDGKFEEDVSTWGFQGGNADGHPIGRLDKVLYLAGKGYKVDPPRRIGVGLTIDTPSGPMFVSDHVGLETTVRMLRPRSGSNGSG